MVIKYFEKDVVRECLGCRVCTQVSYHFQLYAKIERSEMYTPRPFCLRDIRARWALRPL